MVFKDGVYHPKKYVGVNRISMVQGAGLRNRRSQHGGSSMALRTMLQGVRPHPKGGAPKDRGTYTSRHGEKFAKSALGMGLCKTGGGPSHMSSIRAKGKGLMSDIMGSDFAKAHINDAANRGINHLKDKFLPKSQSHHTKPELFKRGGSYSKGTPNPAAPGVTPQHTGRKQVGAPSGIGNIKSNQWFGSSANTRPPQGIKTIHNRGGSSRTISRVHGKGLIAGFGGV